MAGNQQRGTGVDTLRRKFVRRSRDGAAAGDLAGFGLSLARAMRDRLGVAPDIGEPDLRSAGPAELAERVPEYALIALLDRAEGGGTGCLVVPAPVLSGLVELLTTGGVSVAPVVARRPTRADAAMLSGLVDTALSGLADAGPPWRYAAHLPEARPLSLLLDDAPLALWSATVTLDGASRSGDVLLALPLRRNGAEPAIPPLDIGRARTQRLDLAEARLDAVVGRLALPLAQVTALAAGDVLTLGGATLDAVCLAGADGRIIAQGRLGQMHGKRALRLSGAPALQPDAAGETGLRVAG